MNRSTFLYTLGLFPLLPSLMKYNRIRRGENSYFTIKSFNKRYFFVDPEGKPFFSIGLNHVDSATLRYTANGHIWNEKYGNSIEKWLKEGVRKDFKKWGFNTLGWNQEVVTRQPHNHRHSRNFTPEEYRWLGMPYFHMLHFADFHQWENEIRYPDFFSKGFEEWCDYVARDEASRLADDPNLVGYFYIDCPTWVHINKDNEWKGPFFDPERLKTETGRKDLFRIASKYYKTANEAIRRYDKNHLIFGDRYEASKLIAEEVVMAALPHVDALSFQHFSSPEEVVSNLNFWHKKTGLPTLLADCSHTYTDKITGYSIHSSDWYNKMYNLLKETPSCVGYHLCGAYLANRCRKKGLLDEQEKTESEIIEMIKNTNLEMDLWVKKITAE